MTTIKVSPPRMQTHLKEVGRTINDDGNKITFDFSDSSVVKITTVSEDKHACQVTLTTREWYLLNELKDTIYRLKTTTV
jgi:hypothetical protein